MNFYIDSLGKVAGLMFNGGNTFARRVETVSMTDTLKLAFTQYNNLGWNAIRNSEFNNALTYLLKGLQLDSTHLGLMGNLAHAYLFTGNYNKAIEIYKKHRGQYLDKNYSWDDGIKSDFSTFKTDGLPYESMNRVLKELNLE